MLFLHHVYVVLIKAVCVVEAPKNSSCLEAKEKKIPRRDLVVDKSASAPQLDSSNWPRMLTKELPRFSSAAFSGAT